MWRTVTAETVHRRPHERLAAPQRHDRRTGCEKRRNRSGAGVSRDAPGDPSETA